MPKAGSFGQQFLLLKSIQTAYYISAKTDLFACPLVSTAASDTTNPAAEFTAGFFQAGHMTLTIGAKPYVEVPKPFMYCPPADGETMLASAVGGIYNNVTTGRSYAAYADLNRDQQNRYLVDPNILFEAEQQFAVTIDFQSGLIPLIATATYEASTVSTIYVGVILDGILFRPVQ